MKHLDALFREKGKTCLIWIGRERVTDPESNHKETKFYSPVTIKILDVNDLNPEQMRWKMGGQYTSGGKVLVIDRDYYPMIKISHKLTIESADYYGAKDATASSFQIRNIDTDYFQVYTVRRED